MNKHRKGSIISVMVGLIFIVGFVGLLSISPIISYTTIETATITVKEKERVCSGSSNGTSCKYLIYTDQGVYENVDDFWQWKFNSSDIYSTLEEGYTYEATVNGFRIPFLSMYKNILEIN